MPRKSDAQVERDALMALSVNALEEKLHETVKEQLIDLLDNPLGSLDSFGKERLPYVLRNGLAALLEKELKSPEISARLKPAVAAFVDANLDAMVAKTLKSRDFKEGLAEIVRSACYDQAEIVTKARIQTLMFPTDEPEEA